MKAVIDELRPKQIGLSCCIGSLSRSCRAILDGLFHFLPFRHSVLCLQLSCPLRIRLQPSATGPNPIGSAGNGSVTLGNVRVGSQCHVVAAKAPTQNRWMSYRASQVTPWCQTSRRRRSESGRVVGLPFSMNETARPWRLICAL